MSESSVPNNSGLIPEFEYETHIRLSAFTCQ
jgi:hypothetical protein